MEELLQAARIHCGACAGLVGDVKPMIIEITERELLTDIDTAMGRLLNVRANIGARMNAILEEWRVLADEGEPVAVEGDVLSGALAERVRRREVRRIDIELG